MYLARTVLKSTTVSEERWSVWWSASASASSSILPYTPWARQAKHNGISSSLLSFFPSEQAASSETWQAKAKLIDDPENLWLQPSPWWPCLWRWTGAFKLQLFWHCGYRLIQWHHCLKWLLQVRSAAEPGISGSEPYGGSWNGVKGHLTLKWPG